MPSDPAGNYSLPPIYYATPGTTILAEQHNLPLEDIATALSNRLMRDGRNGMVGDLDMGTSFKIKNLKAGTLATDAANISQVIPIGAVVDWALKNAPAGWLLCYGQTLLSDTAYPLLRQALIDDGFPHGQDGSGNPKVPDYRGRGGIGKDDMGGTTAGRITAAGSGITGTTLGATGGSQTHELTAAQNGPHTHTGTTNGGGAHNHTVGASYVASGLGSTGGYIQPSGTGATTSTEPNHTHSFTTNSSGSGDPHNNVQPSIISNKIIRASY